MGARGKPRRPSMPRSQLLEVNTRNPPGRGCDANSIPQRALSLESGRDIVDSRMTDFSAYTVSIHYDRRLYRQDIAGSVAHARMLARQGIIGEEDSAAIIED